MNIDHFLPLEQGSANISVKGEIVNILDFEGQEANSRILHGFLYKRSTNEKNAFFF